MVVGEGTYKEWFKDFYYVEKKKGHVGRRRSCRGLVQCGPGGSPRQGPWRSDPQLLKLAIGTWNITSLMGKEPELV